MLFLDGVYVERPDGSLRFRWVKALTSAELSRLTQALVLRIGRYLERPGLLERDTENIYLVGDALEAGLMEQLLGSSITYRIAVGPQKGRKVFTLQTLPACDEPFDGEVGKVARLSLHAGVAARADQRQKLQRLCRYISRPAISEKRLSLTPNGNVRYPLKTPYRDGTTHVIFEPLDFIGRLAALVLKPRVNLTRFHGIFAPNTKYRVRVTPAKWGRGGQHARTADPEDTTPAERRAAMTWAQRLKRVFGIDIETCLTCGGAVRVIAARVVRQNGLTPRKLSLGCATSGAATALACCLYRNDCDDFRRFTQLAEFRASNGVKEHCTTQTVDLAASPSTRSQDSSGSKRRFMLLILRGLPAASRYKVSMLLPLSCATVTC